MRSRPTTRIAGRNEADDRDGDGDLERPASRAGPRDRRRLVEQPDQAEPRQDVEDGQQCVDPPGEVLLLAVDDRRGDQGRHGHAQRPPPAGVSIPAPEHAAGRLVAHVGHAVGGDPPELRVEHLERDVAVVADPAEVVQDRPDLEVPLAREDAVGVAGQLARGPAEVARPGPRRGSPRRGRPGPRTCSGRCSSGTGRGRPPPPRRPTCAIRASVVSRLAQNRGRLLELQRDPDAGARARTSAASASASAAPAVVGGGEVGQRSAATTSVGTPSSWRIARRRRK